MKKIFVALLFSGILSGCDFSSKPPKNAELLIQETQKVFLHAKKFDFYESGRILVKDDNGVALGRILYTDPLSAGAKGFRGPVPVMVFLDPENEIVAVTLLPNEEDEPYLNRIADAGFFDCWKGISLNQADSLKINAVTGATFSSNAIIQSVNVLLRNEK